MMPKPKAGNPIRAGLVVLFILTAAPGLFPAELDFLAPRVDYFLTTDLLKLADGDYQAEFGNVLSARTSWTIRVGYYKHRQFSSQTYEDGQGRYELGFRWRTHLLQSAPHWLFVGLGWNNRPQDGMATPLAELGFSLNIRPLTLMILGSYGYEVYLNETPGLDPRWVGGLEIRAGLCF